jgi:ABC-type polysaccharide/polyol phosphate transport system ATPase subunit
MDICDRALWLDHGRLVDDGPIEGVVGEYKNFMKRHASSPAG